MTATADASVPRRGPKLEPLLLPMEERAELERWTRRATSAQALALRARIVLACAGPEVPPIVEVARELRVAAEGCGGCGAEVHCLRSRDGWVRCQTID